MLFDSVRFNILITSVIARLGEFNRAKNFPGVIGWRITKSGVEDLWIESDICGSNVATKIISETHYNRATRAHKLTLEALERLQWNNFVENGKTDEKEMNCIKGRNQKFLSLFQQRQNSVLQQRTRI